MPLGIDRPSTTAPDSLEDGLRAVLSALRARSAAEPTRRADAPDAGVWPAGALVALLGFDDQRVDLAGSLYAHVVLEDGTLPSPRPPSEMERERCEMTHACRAELASRALCQTARAIGPGGLLGAIAAAGGGLGDASLAVGCALVLPAPRAMGTQPAASIATQLFHEAPGRVLLAIPATCYADATLLAASHGVPLLPLGRTGGRELVVRATDGDNAFREVLRVSLATLCSLPGSGS